MSLLTTAGTHDAGRPGPADRIMIVAMATPHRTDTASMVARLADLSIDDGRLASIRGGFGTGSGVDLSFGFQQATYANQHLVQTIVVPTLTVNRNTASINGSPAASTAFAAALSGSSLAPSMAAAAGPITVGGDGMLRVQVNSQSMPTPSVVSNGLTSLMASLGNGGVTNVISSTANNQLVQQVTTVTIGVNGLSGLLQQSLQSSVMSRLVSTNSTLR